MDGRHSHSYHGGMLAYQALSGQDAAGTNATSNHNAVVQSNSYLHNPSATDVPAKPALKQDRSWHNSSAFRTKSLPVAPGNGWQTMSPTRERPQQYASIPDAAPAHHDDWTALPPTSLYSAAAATPSNMDGRVHNESAAILPADGNSSHHSHWAANSNHNHNRSAHGSKHFKNASNHKHLKDQEHQADGNGVTAAITNPLQHTHTRNYQHQPFEHSHPLGGDGPHRLPIYATVEAINKSEMPSSHTIDVETPAETQDSDKPPRPSGGTVVIMDTLTGPMKQDNDFAFDSIRSWVYDYFKKWKGVPGQKPLARDTPLHLMWSWIGAFISIMCIALVNKYLSPEINLPVLVASFGASAVLVFGVPDGKLSQPRNFVGGQILSALTGVAVRNIFPNHLVWLSSAIGMATALVVMQVTLTTHPPGGATALIAASIPQIGPWHGFQYVVTVIFACGIMLLVALIINNVSYHRRYPMFWW